MQNQNKFVYLYQQKQTDMKTIIFKSEKNAKVYQVISAKAQGVYAQGEVIRTVKTDNIEKLNSDGQYQATFKEVK